MIREKSTFKYQEDMKEMAERFVLEKERKSENEK